MNKISSLIAVAAFSLLVLGLPAIVSAQYGNGGYGNGGYGNGGYGNGGYGGYGNGGYNSGGYYGDMRSVARELKDISRRFEKDLDRSPTYSRNNNGRYGGYGNYGAYGNGGYNGDYASRVRKLADSFGDAARDFANSVGNGRNYNNGYDEANRMLNLGNQLDRELRNRGLDSYLQDDWQRIQYDLRIVSSNYGNRRYRGNRNGGYNNGLPSWWPF